MDALIAHEFLTRAVPWAIAAFLATAMFSLGLDLTVAQIVEPLRNKRLIAISLVANVVLVPLLALGIAGVIPMDRALRTGFLLYAFAAGLESGPKFVQMAKGNAAFAIGLLALQTMITVVALPMVVSLVAPDAHVARGEVLLKLLVVVAVPIGAGLYLKAHHPAFAMRLGAVVHRLWTILLLVVFAQIIYVNFDKILEVESSALLAGALLFAFAFAGGYAMGGPDRANRRALAIMTFARNASISMTIASQVFLHDPKVLAMITVMATMSIVLVAVAAACFRYSPSVEARVHPLPSP